MLKKLIFLLLVSCNLIFSQFKNLQNFDERDLRFGYYIGLNQYDNKVEYKNNTLYPISVERAQGINVGLIGELKLNKNLFLSLEPGLHANKKNKIVINATCPLVTKVHVQAMKFFELGYRIILIGHKNHPEVIGTMGQLPSGSIELVETVSDVMKLSINDNDNFAYLTQTTLSLDDTKKIIEALKVRLPKIISSPKEDICYATSNRQKAIKEYAQMCDAFIVVGSSNSSNSNRLVEVAKNAGCENSILLENEVNLNVKDYELMTSIGISSGASVPDILVKKVINKFAEFYQVTIEELSLGNENVTFKLPKELRVG